MEFEVCSKQTRIVFQIATERRLCVVCVCGCGWNETTSHCEFGIGKSRERTSECRNYIAYLQSKQRYPRIRMGRLCVAVHRTAYSVHRGQSEHNKIVGKHLFRTNNFFCCCYFCVLPLARCCSVKMNFRHSTIVFRSRSLFVFNFRCKCADN